MRTAIMLAIALAAMPALAQPRLDVPVTITTTPMTTPVCFFFFCGLPLDVVPDGAGGFVPFTNSRVMPDGSLRPFDPAIDGLPPDGHGVAAFFTPPPMPEPPPEHYYDPPPRRPSPARPFHWRDPNPSSEAVPDTRDLKEPQ